MITSHAFSIDFAHGGQHLRAQIYLPEYREIVSDGLPGPLPVWIAKYDVHFNGTPSRREASGDDWLQALLMAVEGVRLMIPEGEEDLWKTPDGVPSWIILPRLVPIEWGYGVYREGCAALGKLEKQASSQAANKGKK